MSYAAQDPENGADEERVGNHRGEALVPAASMGDRRRRLTASERNDPGGSPSDHEGDRSRRPRALLAITESAYLKDTTLRDAYRRHRRRRQHGHSGILPRKEGYG